MIRFLAFLFATTAVVAQVSTTSIDGLREKRVPYVAYVNCTAIPYPGARIDSAVIIVRDERIVRVGKNLEVPQGADVRDLLSQGYDLEAVYAPYRRTMANELELQPDEIDLNDSTLRMAITDKGDMNLYDFKKALRQDNRWQYTGTAKEEVSDAALRVLRDFGFQG